MSRLQGDLRRSRTTGNESKSEPFPIRRAAESCRQGLQECTVDPSLQQDHWAENRSAEFNLWDSGVGACAIESNCLDKRLEHDVSAQKVVIGALETLAAWTVKCIELANKKIDATQQSRQKVGSRSTPIEVHDTDTLGAIEIITLAEAKITVETLLKSLVDLEIAIRRAGTASRIRRADRTFHKRAHCADYRDLSQRLAFLLRVSGARRNKTISETQPSQSGTSERGNVTRHEISVQSALAQLQGEQSPLRCEQEVLLLANIKRHDRFQFFKGRQEHLKPRQNQEPTQAVRVQVNKPRPPLREIQSQQEIPMSPNIQPVTVESVPPPRSQYSTGTTNQASDYAPDSSIDVVAETATPGVAATTIALRADYPKPPRDKSKCPYCFIPFKGETKDARWWKKHASEDLQPYTCYQADCPQGHPFFNTFDAWKSHVLSKSHQRFEGWTCLICKFTAGPAEESAFLDHLQSKHSNSVARKSVTNFATMCRTSTGPLLDQCPICSILEDDWKIQKAGDPEFEPKITTFLEHIGQCIHYFALKVLPDTELHDSENNSQKGPTNVSPAEDRSWPSDYLHVSHHTDSGIAESDLDAYPQLRQPDPVSILRTQAWVEMAARMDDPNSNDPITHLEAKPNATNVGGDQLDDEDFLVTSPTSHNLQDELYNSFEMSDFNEQRRPYLPAGLLDVLVTASAIGEELDLDHLDASTAAKFSLSQQSKLVDWILKSAKKLFAICVELGLRPRRNLLATFLRFHKYGFDDGSLPIQNPREHPWPTARNSSDPIFHNRVWSSADVHLFYDKQWKYLVPVFTKSQYDYDLPRDCILPFKKGSGVPKHGAFSTVYEVRIHVNHMEYLERSSVDFVSRVAVKEIHVSKAMRDTDDTWELEARMLRTINTLKHKHIINCIAAVRRGENRYFIFPWADGGSLRDLWSRSTVHTPERPIVHEVITQLRGLTDALDELHNFKGTEAHQSRDVPSERMLASNDLIGNNAQFIRHGNLKPENILIFGSSPSSIGELRIADMGLAKRHDLSTEDRANLTGTRYGTIRYEAPEVIAFSQPRSRRYDIWSMGCITLELIIWMLYGNNGLEAFYGHLQGPWEGMATSQFFSVEDNNGSKQAIVDPIVRYWMDHMRNEDPECSQQSAIRDLLDIVRDHLLVVALPGRGRFESPDHSLANPGSRESTRHRATARQFCDLLDRIIVKMKENNDYVLTENSRKGVQLPTPPTDTSTVSASLQGQFSVDFATKVQLPASALESVAKNSNTREYTNKEVLHGWEFPVDNKFAAQVVSHFDPAKPPRLPQNSTPANLCHRCNELNFWAGGFDLEVSVADLEARGIDCDFCRMLHSACAKHGALTLPMVRFERSGSNILLVAHTQILALSILRSYELETPIPIQLGFPELPIIGSDAFFHILEAWLYDCDANHDECQAAVERQCPTRVIDVGTSENPKVRLVQWRDVTQGERHKITPSNWIALSFVWGPSGSTMTMKLTKANFNSFEHEIPSHNLAATYLDAIRTTRALRCRYLWIDSLCIIQDDPEDWEREAPRIENIFSGAFCVIAASRARNAGDGFLNTRSTRQYVTFQRSGEKPFYICEPIEDFDQDVLQQPLHQRAWTLQEHALARRTIFFGSQQTYFECGNGVRCETLVKMRNDMAGVLGDPHFPNQILKRHSSRGTRVMLIQDLYRRYSRLQLTFERDKPIAIEALESRLTEVLGLRGQHGVFEDSLDGTFYRTLLWRRGDDEKSLTRIEPLARFDSHRVPSWCPIAHRGGIDYLNPPFGEVEWKTADIQPPRDIHLRGTRISGLLAEVRKFTIDLVDLKAITAGLVLDPGDQYVPHIVEYVIVATPKPAKSKRIIKCYVLFVVRLQEQEADGKPLYERVGAGEVPGHFIDLEKDGVRCYII